MGITGLAIAFGAVGLVIRERRALVVSMAERAARLELERDQESRLGATVERARIAREMHDIVSHNLTDFGLLTVAPSAGLGLPRSGRGLTGMRERANAFGKKVLTGPRPEGAGRCVHLALPLDATVGVPR